MLITVSQQDILKCLVSPQPKDIHFTVTDYRNQKRLIFNKVQMEGVCEHEGACRLTGYSEYLG